MTTIPPSCTPEQRQLLELNERFIPAAILDDGDLIILEDAGPMGGPYEGTHIAKYLPWMLTRDGKIHGISWHYQHYHDLSIPPGDLHPPEPGPDLEAPERLLLTLGAARTYLADTYDVRVSTRALRNWCHSGKITCRRLSDRAGAPWYTTPGALDQVAGSIDVVVDAPGPEDIATRAEEDPA